MTLHARTRAEIEALDIGRSPLIICDVDEVVLSFIGGFERHIGRHGHFLDPKSYALARNAKRRGDAFTLPRAEVTADLVRPTTVGYDFQVPLEDVGDGRYAATIAFPLSGQWEVDITALHPQGSYRLTERIYVR